VTESAFVSTVALFPWATLAEPLTLGRSVRLLPYAKGHAPGDTERAKQEDLDNVLRAYSNGTHRRVSEATLIEVDGWHTGMEADVIARERLFRARIILGFSALSHRRLFSSLRYCCYDTYTMVVQQYETGHADRFVYSTRRRDGGTSNYWNADGFAFHRPLHVDSRARIELDKELAAILLDLPSDADDPLIDALEEFNSANTDSPDVPLHIEAVLVKSAFERLLRIGSNAKRFSDALQACIPDMDGDLQGPLLDKWKSRFPRAPSILGAWAQEFSALRGANAHGMDRKLDHFVWSSAAHLSFASILFPLIVKKKLADAGLWVQPEEDVEKLRRIQDYLMHDPFNVGHTNREDSHPWSNIDGEVLMAGYERRMREGLRKEISKALDSIDGTDPET
jgi:hypothetical protein